MRSGDILGEVAGHHGVVIHQYGEADSIEGLHDESRDMCPHGPNSAIASVCTLIEFAGMALTDCLHLEDATQYANGVTDGDIVGRAGKKITTLHPAPRVDEFSFR